MRLCQGLGLVLILPYSSKRRPPPVHAKAMALLRSKGERKFAEAHEGSEGE